MKPQASVLHDDFEVPPIAVGEVDETSDNNLWFLPGPIEEETDDLPPGPRAEPREMAVLDDWRKAEAGHAARLARVAGRLGALDERLKRGPEGWRHRLALIEAADLSWFAGDRVAPDRLALWISMRLSGVQDDTTALARVGWAVRRLTGGPGPDVDLSAFLDRRDPENMDDVAEPFSDRAEGWLDLMAQADDLHPITRACMGFHLWNLAGLGQHSDRMEAAVTAARIALARRDGNSKPDRDAAPRRYRRMVSAGRNRDVTALGKDTAGAARRTDRMAPRLGPHGRDHDRRQSSGRAAQPCLDGSAGSDPRDDRPGAIPDVARDELGSPYQVSAIGQYDCIVNEDGAR
jgi:hypothetical protein